MTRRILIVVLCLVFLMPLSSLAKNSFPQGQGAKYMMMSEGSPLPTYINIYITESKFSRIGIEYFFVVGNGLFKMWQLFFMELQDRGPLKITEGYIQTSKMDNPEKMTREHFYQNKGVELSDFLMADNKDLKKLEVGKEKVQLKGFSVDATKYQKQKNGQKVTFWISPKAKPLGLVKLVSTGKNENHKYKLELVGKLVGMKAHINPAQAVSLSDKGRKFLQGPK